MPTLSPPQESVIIAGHLTVGVNECEANLQSACFSEKKRLQIPGG